MGDASEAPHPRIASAALIRLIGIDVDGTLVGASGEIPASVWDAARRAREAGIHLALCSGRPAFGLALEYARQLDPTGWHVFQNGSSIIHLASNRSLSATLPSHAVETLIQQARATDRILELYTDSACAVESTAPWAIEHADLLGIPFEPRPLDSLQEPIVRAQWLVGPDDVQWVREHAPVDTEVAESTSPLMPETHFVGLTHSGVSKGTAILTVAIDYGFGLEDVMYIGDAGNDLSALRIVGLPVAMANAHPEVLAVAKHVAGHVEQAGIIDAFELAIATRKKGRGG